MGAEWWHFQYDEGLKHGVTSFGSELLKLYEPAQLNKYAGIRSVLNKVYGTQWN